MTDLIAAYLAAAKRLADAEAAEHEARKAEHAAELALRNEMRSRGLEQVFSGGRLFTLAGPTVFVKKVEVAS